MDKQKTVLVLIGTCVGGLVLGLLAGGLHGQCKGDEPGEGIIQGRLAVLLAKSIPEIREVYPEGSMPLISWLEELLLAQAALRQTLVKPAEEEPPAKVPPAKVPPVDEDRSAPTEPENGAQAPLPGMETPSPDPIVF